MTDDRKTHWQAVYQAKQPGEVSWFRPHLETSMELLKKAGLNQDSRVIDVGAGASTLVDYLLEMGVASITAVDLSEASLAVARARLGATASQVQWIVGDVTQLQLPSRSIDLWHDRAVLHFLVDESDTHAYVRLARQAIAERGFAVIGGFAADGPEKCSGLLVARRDPEDIAGLFSPFFTLVEGRREMHMTPGGSPQRFAYALLQKTMATD